MSGHSKWANIKHQKGAADAKRGQMFTKLTREIMVAVRQGGGNAEANFRLRLAVQKARDNNMPTENIERAIKRASGTAEGASLVEMMLEGYGPSGVAILVQALSDNRNRTVQDIRNIFSRSGGNLASSGSVAWLFDSKGVITLENKGLDVDEVSLSVIDAGADDIQVEGGYIEIHTRPEDLEKVRKALEEKNIPIVSAAVSMVPKTMVNLEEKTALQTLKLLEKLDELDEVQHVSYNADFDEAVVEKYQVGA